MHVSSYLYLQCMQLWTPYKHTLHIRNSQDNHSTIYNIHPHFTQPLIPYSFYSVGTRNPCTLATPLCFTSEHERSAFAYIDRRSHHKILYNEIYTRQWLRVLHWMNFVWWWLGKCGTNNFQWGGWCVVCRRRWNEIYKKNCMDFWFETSICNFNHSDRSSIFLGTRR